MEELMKKYEESKKTSKESEFLNSLDILQLMQLKYELGLIKIGKNYGTEFSLNDILTKMMVEDNFKSRLKK